MKKTSTTNILAKIFNKTSEKKVKKKTTPKVVKKSSTLKAKTAKKIVPIKKTQVAKKNLAKVKKKFKNNYNKICSSKN